MTNSEKQTSRAMRITFIAIIGLASVAIIVSILVFSIDWESYLDKHISKLVMSDAGAPTVTPESVGLSYSDVVIPSSDEINLAGWFIPADRARATIVFCRGAKGNIGFWVDMMKQLHDLGHNVLAFDYRGAGLSGGEPSLLSIEKDISAAVDYAKASFGPAATRVGIFGVSIGAAVGINVAASNKSVDAIIADSPFSSFAEMAPRIFKEYAPSLASKLPEGDTFTSERDALTHVGSVSPKPLFIIANEKDEVCPAEMARRLHAKAKPPKLFWMSPGTGHIAAKDVFPTEYWAKVGEFFEKYFVRFDGPQLRVSKVVKKLPDGSYEAKLRINNFGTLTEEDIPVALTVSTKDREIERKIYFPKTKSVVLKLDSEPLNVQVMRFHHVEKRGDTWELMPG